MKSKDPAQGSVLYCAYLYWLWLIALSCVIRLSCAIFKTVLIGELGNVLFCGIWFLQCARVRRDLHLVLLRTFLHWQTGSSVSCVDTTADSLDWSLEVQRKRLPAHGEIVFRASSWQRFWFWFWFGRIREEKEKVCYPDNWYYIGSVLLESSEGPFRWLIRVQFSLSLQSDLLSG